MNIELGTKVVTAYGRNPRPIEKGMIGEYGEIERVNQDGWHDIRLESGELISLNSERYEVI